MPEHRPEEDERWCRKHHEPNARYWFSNFLADRRFGGCRHCQEEDRQQWLADVQSRLEFGLAMAARGQKTTWRPKPDTQETIIARLMDLRGAPATLEEAAAWVRKYLYERPER